MLVLSAQPYFTCSTDQMHSLKWSETWSPQNALLWWADGCLVLLLLCRCFAALRLQFGPPHELRRTRCRAACMEHCLEVPYSVLRSHPTSGHSPASAFPDLPIPLAIAAGRRPSLMYDQPSISNESLLPTGRDTTLFSFPVSEETHRDTSSSPIVSGSTQPSGSLPPRAFIRSLPTTITLVEISVSVDSSSSLPLTLPPSSPPSLPPLPPPPASVQQSSSLSRDTAGGIVVLAILAIIVVAGGLVWCKRRRAGAVEEDPEDALFGACEDPRSPTFRLSAAGSTKGRFGATFRAHPSPYLPPTPRPPKSSPKKMAVVPSTTDADPTPRYPTKAAVVR